MPYQIRKVRGKPCYRVSNIKTKKVFSKCTSRKRAEKQLKLLNAIHYNKNFTPRAKTIKNSK